MLVALLPGAAASADPVIPTPDPTNPTVTIAPILPLEATPTNRDNQQALRRKAGWSEHFQCRDYPADKDLQQADLAPTGNVMFQGAVNKTGSYDIIKVDPRIDDISYREDTNRIKLGPNEPWTTQRRMIYSWTLPKHVKSYGVFQLWTDGKWRGLDPTFDIEAGGIYELPLVRDGEVRSFMVIATDTRTCKPGPNVVPDKLWTSIGLTPPAK